MDVRNILFGGAALGVLAACWEHVKNFAWRLLGLFVRRVELSSESAHQAMLAYLVANHHRLRNYDRVYGADHEHQRDGRYGLIPYEQFGQRSLIFFKGVWPILFSNAREGKVRTKDPRQESSGDDGRLKVYSTLTFLRGTLDVDEVLRQACAAHNRLNWAATTEEEQGRRRFAMYHVPARKEEESGWDEGSSGLPWYQQGHYRLLAHTADQLGKAPLSNGAALGNLIFPQRIKDLIREIELWRISRDWYRTKGIPWKRGWLLYGPPGTGKTALARAFAEDLDLPIYVFNLAQMSNHDLMKHWSDMQLNVPCIALLEDIDNVFHGRKNVAQERMPMFGMPRRKEDDGESPTPFVPLTFDCLLNCLDGVERADGVFTIITTNDIGKVDAALGQPRRLPDGTVEFISTRPGRIDKAVELTYMEPADKKRMAERILGEYPEEFTRMVEFIERYPDLQETPAQFQERCGQIALACFWKEQERARA